MKAVWFLAVAGLGCADAFDIVEIALPDAGEVGSDAITGECPQVFAGSKHLFVQQAKNWAAAQAHCVALDLDATDSWHTHLPVMNTGGELDQLPIVSGNAWLGLTDYKSGTGVSVLANFSWITLEQSVTAWSEFSPEATGTAPYCGFRSSGDDSIHDASCYSTIHPFVCECDLYPVQSEHVPP